MRWQCLNLLDAYRDQWPSAESVLQGPGDTGSPEFGGQGYIHIGAAVGLDNQTEEAAEVAARLQGLLGAVAAFPDRIIELISTHNS